MSRSRSSSCRRSDLLPSDQERPDRRPRLDVRRSSPCCGSGPGRPGPSCRPWLGASPGRSASTHATPYGALLGSARTATDRWSRATPASPGRSDTAQPTTPRSAAETTVPRACARQRCVAAGTERASLAWVAELGVVLGDRPATPDTSPASVRVHLPTDRRSRTARPASDRPERQARGCAPRDLLTLRERQPKLATLPSTRTPSTRVSDGLPQRRVLSSQMLGDPLDRHTRLAHVPDRLLVLLREPNHTTPPDRRHRMLANQDPCCVDQLRTQPYWDTANVVRCGTSRIHRGAPRCRRGSGDAHRAARPRTRLGSCATKPASRC